MATTKSRAVGFLLRDKQYVGLIITVAVFICIPVC